jgi:hypothetical protein
MLLNGKRVDYRQLRAEMIAAGLAVPFALGQAGDDLHTYDATGEIVDVPAGSAAVIAAHVPPALPDDPDYGADGMTDAEFAVAAATAVANLRAYRALASPTVGQRKNFEDLIARIAIHYIKSQMG